MKILGIDPGTSAVGYAILQYAKLKPKLISAGLIPIKTKEAPSRLRELFGGLQKIIKSARPDAVAVERLFFFKNQKTALAVAEARGAILLTISLAQLKIHEYTPLEIKKTVTGDGRADKQQLKKMIRLLLKETRDFKAGDDTYDAIAVALTCCFKEFNASYKGRV